MDSTAKILLDLFVIFAAAKIGGEVCHRLKQPAVVGEIVAGMLIGPSLLGWIGQAEFLDIFAEIGVVFLLFMVGLETDMSELMRVGRVALGVAVAGIVLPFVSGWGLMAGLGKPLVEGLFVGTALVATSVGITARVLADLKQLQTLVARVILGAAVADDILGMIVLAIVSGISRGEFSIVGTLVIVVEAVAFTVFVILVGRRAMQRLWPRFPRLTIPEPAFAVGVALCLGLSAAASYIGLAAIIGAFLAGLVFAEAEDAAQLRHRMEPIYEFLVPIFFVIMGSKVDVPGLFSREILLLGLVVTALALAGKFIGCGLAAWGLGKREAVTIGVGMAPRGEVGIVVAMVGLSRGVISVDIFSVVIMMSVLTTLLTPPLLRMLLARRTVVI